MDHAYRSAYWVEKSCSHSRDSVRRINTSARAHASAFCSSPLAVDFFSLPSFSVTFFLSSLHPTCLHPRCYCFLLIVIAFPSLCVLFGFSFLYVVLGTRLHAKANTMLIYLHDFHGDTRNLLRLNCI